MFIKNLKTGVTWEIVDPKLIRRLKSDPSEFQEIKEAPKGAPPADPGGQDPGGKAPEMKKPGK